VVAFARHVDNQWALVAIPRFLMKLSSLAEPFAWLRVRIDRFPRLAIKFSPSAKPPLGKRLWKETLLHLPDGAPDSWQNVFTGESLMASDHDAAEGGLFVHEIFRRLPVALLVGSTTT
jgi:maltooligosyltrehalose synthase